MSRSISVPASVNTRILFGSSACSCDLQDRTLTCAVTHDDTRTTTPDGKAILHPISGAPPNGYFAAAGATPTSIVFAVMLCPSLQRPEMTTRVPALIS